MGDAARELLETATSLRGLVSVARSEAASPASADQEVVESTLAAAELAAVRLTIDLERLASGKRPLTVTIT